MAAARLYDTRNGSGKRDQSIFPKESLPVLGALHYQIQDRQRFCSVGGRRMVSVYRNGTAHALSGCDDRDAHWLYPVYAEERKAARESNVFHDVRFDPARSTIPVKAFRGVFSAVRRSLRGVQLAGFRGKAGGSVARRVST